jgi:hypothetical protein
MAAQLQYAQKRKFRFNHKNEKSYEFFHSNRTDLGGCLGGRNPTNRRIPVMTIVLVDRNNGV